MAIIIFDTETTDRDINNRLVQLAYKNLSTGEFVNEYFKPSIPITFGAMAVHHITNEMVENKKPFAESEHKKNLIDSVVENIFVAHNAPFDIQVLKNEGVEVKKNIDTLRVARHLLESEQYSLQYLRYSLGLNVVADAHDALGDVLVLESLFQYLSKIVKDKFTLDSDEKIVDKLLELNDLPVLLTVVNFGKYKGKSFADVAEVDKGYLQWLFGSETQKSEPEQNKELVYTLKHYL